MRPKLLSKDMRVCLADRIMSINKEVMLVRVLAKIRRFLRGIGDIDA